MLIVNKIAVGEWKKKKETLRIACWENDFGHWAYALTQAGSLCLLINQENNDLKPFAAYIKKRWGNPSTIISAAEMLLMNQQLTQLLNHQNLNLPIQLIGTSFQLAIWQALLTIPFGETSSYAVIASAAGHPKALRATGTAIGNNPIALFIPCHRVLRTDGSLGGYAWGLALKQQLLQFESDARFN